MMGTGQRVRKKSKKNTTESEEYDSLNSDSDTASREVENTIRGGGVTEDEPMGPPVNFSEFLGNVASDVNFEGGEV